MATKKGNRPLTTKQKLFCECYVADPEMNARRAAEKAGYKCVNANSFGVTAHTIMSQPHVQAYIAELTAGRSKKLDISAEKVLKEWDEIAFGDPFEAIQFRRTCCRHCHGKGFKYQYRQAEWNNLVKQMAECGRPMPDPEGGTGFRGNDDPNPHCPECDGEGIGSEFMLDSRNLTKAQRKLITSIQQTRDGIKVTFRDQDKALESLAKHLGMFVEKIDVNVKYGLADKMAKARERMRKADKE
jgi:phage terminase small subunit